MILILLSANVMQLTQINQKNLYGIQAAVDVLIYIVWLNIEFVFIELSDNGFCVWLSKYKLFYHI